MLRRLLTWTDNDPFRLFLLDGIGAMVSAILLGVVLVNLEWLFGIPRSALYVLAACPCLFAVYDVYCYQKGPKHLAPYLTAIAAMNAAYCLLSIGLAIYHKEMVTLLGWAYITTEILIVAFLATFEYQTAKRLAARTTGNR
ncbi:MAG: hypothetical protein AAFV95_27155 [Bacteroidota bacterium]